MFAHVSQCFFLKNECVILNSCEVFCALSIWVSVMLSQLQLVGLFLWYFHQFYFSCDQMKPERRSGHGPDRGGKINRAKQTWRGLSSVAPRYTHKHTLESHKHTFAKEVSGPVTGGYRETEMTVLRMEVLNRAPLAGLCESVSAWLSSLSLSILLSCFQLFLMKGKRRSFPAAAVCN